MINWLAVEAVGTCGAFATGLILLNEQRRDSKRRVDDARREQAKLVTHWWEPSRRLPDSDGVHGYVDCRIIVRNASNEPVYVCSALVMAMMPGGPQTLSIDFGTVPPETTEQKFARWKVLMDSDDFKNTGDFLTAFHFTDAAGRVWRRGHNGVLKLKFEARAGRLAKWLRLRAFKRHSARWLHGFYTEDD